MIYEARMIASIGKLFTNNSLDGLCYMDNNDQAEVLENFLTGCVVYFS